MILPDPKPEEMPALWWQQAGAGVSPWVARTISAVCVVLTGYFLVLLNNTFLLIRRRASVQTAIYFLFVAACPDLHFFYPSVVVSILVLFACQSLFRCYQSAHPVGHVLNAFVALGIGSLIIPQITFFGVVFLIGVSSICGLTLRNLLAAVVGWCVPYLFLFAYAYCTEQMQIFYGPFVELTTFQAIRLDQFDILERAPYIYFFVVFLGTALYTLVNKNKDKISARVFVWFTILLVFSIFIYAFLQPAYALGMLSTMLAGISVVAAHFFVLSNSKSSNAFFVFVLLGLIGLFAMNLSF